MGVGDVYILDLHDFSLFVWSNSINVLQKLTIYFVMGKVGLHSIDRHLEDCLIIENHLAMG